MPSGWARAPLWFIGWSDPAGHATGGTTAQLQLRHHPRHQLELHFDYLRDNMAADISKVAREFQHCVIDEADSI